MAVYTHVGRDDLERFLSLYDAGGLVSYQGIEQGVENSNYVVTTTGGAFVLTLFERRVDPADLPYFLGFMAHVARRGAPAPAPIADRDGAFLQSLCGRPAVLVSFLQGASRLAPSPSDCAAAGALAARLHQSADGFDRRRPNALGLPGWEKLAGATRDRAEESAAGLSALIDGEIDAQRRARLDALPRGPIHADLFPDNLLFTGPNVSGVIDFYFACDDFFAYDLAIAINAFAGVGGVFDRDRAAALVDGYQRLRRLSPAEKAAMPTLLRGAALRFLLTRLYDSQHRVPGAVVRVKDPLEYRDLLEAHRRADDFFWLEDQ